ncbi:MAG: sulfurtransferase, partial [Acidiferrobacterales bacterium]
DSFVKMWAFLLGRRGVTFDNTIVFCGEIAGMTSARGFWFLEYLGHNDTHLLDGGYTAWTRAGLPVSRDAEVPKTKAFKYTLVPDRVATYREVLDAIDNPDKCIVDTRSKKEWLGTDRRAARGGAVPSAVHLDWVNHLTPEGEMKPADQLRRQFEAIGAMPDKEIIPYCNTGYRSAHAYLALRLLGYPYIKNYVGSWQEWGNRSELPVVVPQT